MNIGVFSMNRMRLSSVVLLSLLSLPISSKAFLNTLIIPCSIYSRQKHWDIIIRYPNHPYPPSHSKLYSARAKQQSTKGPWNDSSTKETSGGTITQPEILSSDFWGLVTKKEINSEKKLVLPNVPTLDVDGPLPDGAYLKSSSHDSPERCRIGVALNIPSLWVNLKTESIDSNELVRTLQNYVESGFQTFHLRCTNMEQQRWAEETILRQFQAKTPSFCRNQCHFTVPFSIQQIMKEMPGSTGLQRSLIRQQVLEILDRTNVEVINCLQLKGFPSPYLFDILDILQDLQREGYIQSIDAYQLPPLQQMMAREYDFSLDALYWEANLLDMTKYQDQLLHNKQTKQDDNPLILTTPLAGGLLTERYLGQHEIPKSWQLRWMERFYWNTIYDQWAKRRRKRRTNKEIRSKGEENNDESDNDGEVEFDRGELWTMYQSQLLSTLNQIARKHSVSIPSVMLRWMLQLDHVSGTVVTCQMLYPDDGLVRKTRERQLRQVFMFALDDEDMNGLWELTGLDIPEDNERESDLFDDLVEERNGLFLPTKRRRM